MTPEGEVVYIASVEEKNNGEAEKNHCERYTIENGEYLSVTIKGWRQRTDSIKDVFHEMTQEKKYRPYKTLY